MKRGLRPDESQLNEMRMELVGHFVDGTNLIDVAEDDLFDRVVFENFTDDTTISAADDENLFRVWVACEREMGNHLLISEKGGISAVIGRDGRYGHTKTHHVLCIG